MSIGTLNDGVLFFVIIATNILMMYVLMRFKKRTIVETEENLKKGNTFKEENVFEWDEEDE